MYFSTAHGPDHLQKQPDQTSRGAMDSRINHENRSASSESSVLARRSADRIERSAAANESLNTLPGQCRAPELRMVDVEQL